MGAFSAKGFIVGGAFCGAIAAYLVRQLAARCKLAVSIVGRLGVCACVCLVLHSSGLLDSPFAEVGITAISVVHFTPNAYLISRKTIAKLTVLPSNS